MNDFYFCTSVLAHGLDMSRSEGIFLLIVMPLLVLAPLLYKKSIKVLFVSSIIPYVLVSISILDFSFKLQIPDVLGNLCFAAVWYPNFLINGAFGMGEGFFLAAFIMDTLCIFAIIRLVLYIKHKISAKKSQMRISQ